MSKPISVGWFTEETPDMYKKSAKLLFSGGKSNVNLSLRMLQQMKMHGHTRLNLVSWIPHCSLNYKTLTVFILQSRVQSNNKTYLDVPAPDSTKRSQYLVNCKHCGAILANFESDSASLNPYGKWMNLHLLSYTDGINWYAGRGINVHPETGEVNFECCCLNMPIKNKYTNYEIKPWPNYKQ